MSKQELIRLAGTAAITALFKRNMVFTPKQAALAICGGKNGKFNPIDSSDCALRLADILLLTIAIDPESVSIFDQVSEVPVLSMPLDPLAPSNERMKVIRLATTRAAALPASGFKEVRDVTH